MIYEINTKDSNIIQQLINYIQTNHNTTAVVYTGAILWNGHRDMSSSVTFIDVASDIQLDRRQISKITQTSIRKLVGNNYIVITTTVNITELKQQAKTRINEKASSIILAQYPLWKQSNMMARSIELQSIGSTNWTSSETDEWNVLQTAWNWIKSIRDASNSASSNVDAADTEVGINQAEIVFTGGKPL